MSLIKNLIPEPEKKSKDVGSDEEKQNESKRPIIKSTTDLQRLKIEKLMKNPTKLVQIPDSQRTSRNSSDPPVFVRNVMGSSAGAGSGEFHVYRHLRRKEYARQKNIQIKSHTEQLDEQYQKKLEDNRRAAEDKTAKKRAKRLKKKQRAKQPRTTKTDVAEEQHDQDESSHESEEDKAEADAQCANQETDTSTKKTDIVAAEETNDNDDE